MVLLLDPSLRAFGWGVVDGKRIVDCGCIQTKAVKGKKDMDDLSTIFLELCSIVDELKPLEIISEKPIGSKSNRAAIALGYTYALVVAVAARYNLPLTFVQARSVKKAVTGDPGAEKDQVASVVKDYFVNSAVIDIKKMSAAARTGITDALAIYIYKNHESR